MSEEKQNKATHHRSGIFWPLLLIIIGVILLMNNLGYIQGNLWDILFNCWPVILIAIGLDSAFKGEGIVGAVFLLAVGGIFLLSNFGYLAIDAWQVIIRLWPVLLIAIGLDMLIGRRAIWLSLLGLVLVLAILAGGVWYYGVHNGGTISMGKEISQSLQGIEQAKIDIEPGVGNVVVRKGNSTEYLFAGTIPEKGQIRPGYIAEENKGIYTLRPGDNAMISKSHDNTWNWQLYLSPLPLIDLKIGLGVGRCQIDLTGLKMKALDVNLGIGETQITLPGEGQFQGKIEGAIGRMVIYLPQGMGLRVNSQTGLGNFHASEELIKVGDYYQTTGFDQATNRIDLQVSQAIGVISVESFLP